MWWSGGQVIGHSVPGVPVLRLRRGGRVRSPLPGLVVVRGLIGPRRLGGIGRSLVDEDPRVVEERGER